MSKTISIITVCRNSAATIAKTIESVLAQKYVGVEYLVIDGNSTDGTQDIIESYSGVDTFISEPDQGIADAFNKGIALAQGEIIGIINSDDQLAEGALESVKTFFSEHPDVDVVHGDILLYKDSYFIKRVKPAGRWWYPWRLVLFNHPTTFVRRSIYEQYGLFDTTYKIAMDVELFLRWMMIKVRIAYLPLILASMMTGGISGQHAVKGYLEVRRAVIRHRFSTSLANIQFLGKLVIWLILQIKCRGYN
jgi:glycosyltransferase involved in cell wall biosynthesis